MDLELCLLHILPHKFRNNNVFFLKRIFPGISENNLLFLVLKKEYLGNNERILSMKCPMSNVL